MAEPVLRNLHDAVEAGEAEAGDAEIEDEGPTALEHLRTGEDLPASVAAEAVRQIDHASISAELSGSDSFSFSGRMNLLRETSKSKSSA